MNLIIFHNAKLVFGLLLILWVGVACSKEEEWLEVSEDSGLIAVPSEGGYYRLEVKCAGKWVIVIPEEDWCQASISEGRGEVVVTLRILPNYRERRQQWIAVKSEKLEWVVGICQHAHREDSSGVVGGFLEIPRLQNKEGYQFIVHNVEYEGEPIRNYSLEYDLNKRHARWVAFKAYDKVSVDRVSRTKPDPWADDLQLAPSYRTEREDYAGYDRGHLVASNDRRYCREANVQTFYYSNISPQLPDFNQKIWQKLEEKVKAWMQDGALRDTLYVVKGGTIQDDQLITLTGPSQVAVPRYYFMAVLARKKERYQAIAFWLEHRIYSEPYDLMNKTLSIDELEERTGIDFFPGLPDEIEDRVEATFDINDWE